MCVSPFVGRVLVLIYPLVLFALSALGFTNHVVWGVAAFGILPFLMGALAWRRGRSKNGLLWILALVLLIPLTRWPLWLSLQFVKPQMETLAIETFREPRSDMDSLDYFYVHFTGFAKIHQPCGLFLVESIRIEKAPDSIKEQNILRFCLTTGTILRLYVAPGVRRWEVADL